MSTISPSSPLPPSNATPDVPRISNPPDQVSLGSSLVRASGGMSFSQEICQIRNISNEIFMCSLDERPSDLGDRRVEIFRNFIESAVGQVGDAIKECGENLPSKADLIKYLMKTSDNSIEKLLKKFGASDEMILFAKSNKIDLANLAGKIVSLTFSAYRYYSLSAQIRAEYQRLGRWVPGTPEVLAARRALIQARIDDLEARRETVAARALKTALMLPSLVHLVAPLSPRIASLSSPELTAVSFFASDVTALAGDRYLINPYPDRGALYRTVAIAANIMGTVAYGAMLCTMVTYAKENPDSSFAQATSALMKLKTASTAAQTAYDAVLVGGMVTRRTAPYIAQARAVAEQVAQVAGPVIRDTGRWTLRTAVTYTVDFINQFSDFMRFLNGR